jgi:zinc protease
MNAPRKKLEISERRHPVKVDCKVGRKHNLKRRLGLLVFGLAFAMAGTSAHALEVDRKVLPNGLVVLHAERHNLPLVMVTLLVRAGSIDEPGDRGGLANLTTSLLTEGTQGRSSKEISEEAEFIGAKLGASAGADFSTVTLSVLKKDVRKGFDLFSDILLDPSFPPEEIDRKKELIKGSLRQKEEDPSFLAGRAIKREVFGSHPYGRLVQGSPGSIDRITRDEILRYYSGNFLPNNSILSVVGHLGATELDGLIKDFLGKWEKKRLPPRVHPAVEPMGKKVVLIDKDLTQANILIGHQGIRRDNPDYYALGIMNYILGGGGFSSRLMGSIRDEMGLAYSVYSYFSSNVEAGMFQAGVQTKNESANTVIEEILRQMTIIREQVVSASELDDAKAFLVGSFPRRLDTMRKIADFLARVEFHGLGLDYPDRYPELINSVTKADVLRVAGKYLDPEKYVLVVVARQSEANVKDSP